YNYPTGITDGSVYWAVSGWDLNLLLESETSVADLRSFLATYPNASNVRVVKYSLAVRLSREDQYDEAAQIYQSINAIARAPRLRQMAALYGDGQQSLEGKYKLAEFLSANENRIYFNDALWRGLQRYALTAPDDVHLTSEERNRMIGGERKLKDDQEEYWR